MSLLRMYSYSWCKKTFLHTYTMMICIPRRPLFSYLALITHRKHWTWKSAKYHRYIKYTIYFAGLKLHSSMHDPKLVLQFWLCTTTKVIASHHQYRFLISGNLETIINLNLKMGLHVMAAVPEYSSILYAKVIKSISTAVPEHKQRIPKRFPLIIFSTEISWIVTPLW